MGVLGGKLYVLASHRDRAGAKLSSTRQVVSLTLPKADASPRRLPELEDLPHDSIVAELAQEDNRPIGGRRAFFEYVSFEYGFASWTRAAAREERSEAENLLVRQPTVGLPATAARAHAGDQRFCFDESLVLS